MSDLANSQFTTLAKESGHTDGGSGRTNILWDNLDYKTNLAYTIDIWSVSSPNIIVLLYSVVGHGWLSLLSMCSLDWSLVGKAVVDGRWRTFSSTCMLHWNYKCSRVGQPEYLHFSSSCASGILTACSFWYHYQHVIIILFLRDHYSEYRMSIDLL